MFREAVVAHSNFPVGAFDIIGFEGRFSYEEGVDDDSQRPKINLIGMSIFVLKDLRSDVIRCTANCSFALTFVLELGCQPEVT